MKRIQHWQSIAIVLLLAVFAGCIKDDFIDDRVDPQLRIANKVDSLAINTSYQFEEVFFNNVGLAESAEVLWKSSDPAVVSITPTGLAEALAPGRALITLELDSNEKVLRDTVLVSVGETTVMQASSINGEIVTTSSYVLEGDFTLTEIDGNLELSLGDNYRATSALPGLFVYLTNNSNSIASAKEIAAVKVFSGAHSYTVENSSLSDYSYILYYCKPFNVKVGEGKIQ